MGKWSFGMSGCPNREALKPIVEELKALPRSDLEARWIFEGRLTLNDYGLNWYSGGSGGGWATIDDSATRKQFQIYVDRYEMLTGGASFDYWCHLAVVAACAFGLTVIPPLLLADQMHDNRPPR